MTHTARIVFLAPIILASALYAQAPSFDIVSVKPNVSDQPIMKMNFPLGPGDVYVTNGGYFTASGLPLSTYLFFAYKVLGNDSESVIAQLPGWATSDKFDIQARTDGDPAKDTKPQMRLMMQSLLADRFKLKRHYETRQVPVFAVSPVKAGKLGPQLQVHPADADCTTVLSNANAQAAGAVAANSFSGGFPVQCGGLLIMPSTVPGRIRGGARNVTMGFITGLFNSMGNLGRPVLDQTGMTGTFDFVLEWVPDLSAGNAPVGPDFQPDPNGPSFDQALKEQLGLRLESTKGPSQFLVIDHLEKPSAN